MVTNHSEQSGATFIGKQRPRRFSVMNPASAPPREAETAHRRVAMPPLYPICFAEIGKVTGDDQEPAVLPRTPVDEVDSFCTTD
jgi:hypothetical protein